MTSIRETSGMSAIGGVTVREPSGATIIGSIKARDASNTLVTLFSSFSGNGLSAIPPYANGYTYSHAFQRINTNEVTISVSPPGPVDAVAWSFADAGWDAINPTSLTTAFRSPLCGPSSDLLTTATCTVTRGTTDAAIDVSLFVSNSGS